MNKHSYTDATRRTLPTWAVVPCHAWVIGCAWESQSWACVCVPMAHQRRALMHAHDTRTHYNHLKCSTFECSNAHEHASQHTRYDRREHEELNWGSLASQALQTDALTAYICVCVCRWCGFTTELLAYIHIHAKVGRLELDKILCINECAGHKVASSLYSSACWLGLLEHKRRNLKLDIVENKVCAPKSALFAYVFLLK